MPQTRRSTRAVTLMDVARVAGVSPQTVSRAVRDSGLVSDATLEVVRRAIEATGYVPNLAASHLASNRSKTVAAIIPVISASIFADAVHGLEDVLSAAGYRLFIGSTGYHPQTEERLIRAFLGRRPDGFFIVGTTHTDAARALLANAGVPVVEAFELTDEPIDHVVGFSNAAAITAVVALIVEKGYRHPTFAGAVTAGDSRALARQAGFERAVREHFPGEEVRIVHPPTDAIDMDSGRDLLGAVLERHPETDAIVFSSDVFAAGALLECQRRGISVPGRLAITGFGDFEIAHHLVPQLTTVFTSNREIGMISGDLLLGRMDAAGVRSVFPVSTDVGFKVVSRESA